MSKKQYWTKQDQENHPGYDGKVSRHRACECRSGHWCAKHAAQSARDAGRIVQEREIARRQTNA